MRKRTKILLGISGGLVAAAGLALAVGRRPASHPTAPSELGRPIDARALEALIDQPGPITVETAVSADWQVPREGLLDLDAPAARAAGLPNGDEPIRIYFHALRHPSRGLFLVDSGVARSESALGRFVERAANLRVRRDLAGWLAREPAPLSGVLLTHLHLDHVMGLPDVPDATPLYTGPGETEGRLAKHLFMAPIVDRMLAGKGPIREWAYRSDGIAGGDGIAGVLDVFGDGTLFALWVPGHTPGSTAYLARTPSGPVLLAGDVSHTRWGWDHEVAPGSFSVDRRRGAESLRALRALARRHPQMVVRLGHQD